MSLRIFFVPSEEACPARDQVKELCQIDRASRILPEPICGRSSPMRSLFIIVLFVSPTFAQGWSARMAADYLDSRQEKWFVWPTAQSKDGPCVSCHTGITYL